jgi:pectate lyase
MKKLYLIFLTGIFNISIIFSQGLIIQEDTIGVCTMDGVVESSAEGYTGTGYANIDNGLGIGMSWSFTVDNPGTYLIYWRYALGGADLTSRDARLLVNNVFTGDTVKFPHSGSNLWSVWLTTDTLEVDLEAGLNKIQLSSVTDKGLANIDYFHILGEGLIAAECVPSYIFRISRNIAEGGSVSYEPVQEYYDIGTAITVRASAGSGYFFHSWSGEAASIDSVHTFAIDRNTYLTALFYPIGTTADTGADGYATVQHDNGTPYILTGGASGDTVEADSYAELASYLGGETPRVVLLSKYIKGDNSQEISIGSNKTFLGTNNYAHIEGIRVSVSGSRNVVIRNITFSKVLAADEIEINAGSKNILIDHCEFFTDRDHDDNEDYYDGMLDIKNESSFITVKWCFFHDHNKGILISSGDDSYQDSVQRITFHHNYFFNCNSRLPSIRFGKSHIFNNYYENCGTAVNTRMNACVRVEKNYFHNAGTGVGMLYSPIPGSVELIDNIFENTSYADSPACHLDVPYSYTSSLDTVSKLPSLITANIRRVLISSVDNISNEFIPELICYPNPADNEIKLSFILQSSNKVTIEIYNQSGSLVKSFGDNLCGAGWNEFNMSVSELKPGIYFCKLHTGESITVKKLIVF